MGRAVTNFNDKAAKNRARVRKCRGLKKKKAFYENYVREQIYAYKEVHFQKVCDDIDRSTSDDEEIGDGDDIDMSIEFTDKLRFWAIHHRISHSAINDLLSILIFGGFAFLPRNSRTFLRTPPKVEITNVTNGQLWFHGIRKCLEITLSKIQNDISATLDFSFDGLPLFKSSNTQFWPMLFSIQGIFHSCNLLFEIL